MRDANAVELIKLIRPTGKLTFRVLPSCPANAGHPVRCGHAAGAHTIKPGEIQHSDARCRFVSLFAARIAGEPLRGREYALVYRAGFLNQTTSFKFRLWDKSYDFTHVRAPRLEKYSTNSWSLVLRVGRHALITRSYFRTGSRL